MTDTFSFTVTDADMKKLFEMINELKVDECPYFEIQDKQGKKATYYREDVNHETEPKQKENGSISYMNDERCMIEPPAGLSTMKKRLLAEELRKRKVMIEDFEGIIHDVIPEIDVYDVIEEVLGWRI